MKETLITSHSKNIFASKALLDRKHSWKWYKRFWH